MTRVYTTEMEQGQTIFWAEAQPPASLYQRVLARLALARQRQARVRTLLLGLVSTVLGALLIPVVELTAHNLYASGFYEYASLLFSDSAFVFSFSKEFFLSLLESLPSLSILLLIAVTGGLVWSLYRTITQAKVGFARPLRAS